MGPKCLFMVALVLASSGSVGQADPQEPMFDAKARATVKEFWAKPESYRVESTGKPVVRLTVEGSRWLHAYNRALGRTKGDPAVDAAAQTPDQQAWETWINAKVAYDQSVAQAKVDGKPAPGTPPECPESLLKLAGKPPLFAEAVVPNRHLVMLRDGSEFAQEDNVAMRPRYLYYRFREGIMSPGTATKKLAKDELDDIFRSAGITESEQRIMCAVSSLEGGFDSVNTYDTGFVSVGLIQFACMSTGTGSLGAVMRRMKNVYPEEFDRDFRSYGLDVTDLAQLVVYDPEANAEYVGADAAQAIIRQPRLAILFRRAGQQMAFRSAQLRVAKDLYFPSELDTVKVRVGEETQTVPVLDLIATEAGRATLMDRKVHLGTHEPITAILDNLGREINAQTLEDFRRWEGEIIYRLKHRRDYMADPVLSQPAATSRMRDASRSSRGKGGGGTT